MNNQNFSAYYYPTTTFIVDNDEGFLENFSAHLSWSCLTSYSSDVFNALSIIRENHVNYQKNIIDLTGYLLQQNDLSFEYKTANKIETIKKHLKQPERFNHISTVVVDYFMPSMNGIEFCRELKELPVKKLILTGAADNGMAVDAFNEGIIDGFIQKSSMEMVTQVSNLIGKLTKKYFRDLTMPFPNLFLSKFKQPYKEYIELLFDVITTHHIQEYYQIDDKGSFILLDKKNQALWFLVISKSQIEEYYDIALYSRASFSVISAIKNHQKIPVLLDEADHKKPVCEWGPLLQPLKKFKTIPNFYYLIVEDRHINKLEIPFS